LAKSIINARYRPATDGRYDDLGRDFNR
jgi:hypothetical protein